MQIGFNIATALCTITLIAAIVIGISYVRNT